MNPPALPPASHAAPPDALRNDPALRERGLELGDVLGMGGSAVVYRARDVRLARDVAVKILRSDAASRTAGERFKQEIRVAAGLRHPNVLPLFDSGELADGRLFSVMPLAGGHPLSVVIGEGRLLVAEAVRLARETAEALAYLHDRGFVHRDVKPENIFVESGHAVLTDFGLAASAPTLASSTRTAPAQPAEQPDHFPSTDPFGGRLTLAGTAVGTLPYMSPEAMRGDEGVDARTDTYALAIVLYQMLAGRLPFNARTPTELLARRAREPWPSLREVRPDVPPALEAIIVRGAATDPAARFPSAHAMAAALAAFEAAGTRWSTRRKLAVAATLIGVVAILGLLARTRLQESVALDPGRVVIADLVNDTGNPAYGSMGVLAGDIIAEAVTAGTRLTVVNATVALPSRLQRLLVVEDTTLARKTRALVNETRAGLVVTGAYFRSGGANEFVAEVTNAISGNVLGIAGPVLARDAVPDAALHALADSVVAILQRHRVPVGQASGATASPRDATPVAGPVLSRGPRAAAPIRPRSPDARPGL